MALVLTAGVVQAQNTPNFGNRANLTQAKKARCNVYGSHKYSWDSDGKVLATIFTDVQTGTYEENGVTIPNIPSGKTMAETYENFVIRVSGLSDGASYSVQFLDDSDHVLYTFTYWFDDVHISPLRSLFTPDEINQIHKVKLIGNGNSGELTLEEAYFISAYKGLIEKATDINGNEVYAGFLDKNNVDIGNAYIDPSYLIRSNRLWVDIHEEDRTFDIVCEQGSEDGTLTFSLPYKTGIDMSEVTFTATDFDRTANVMNRYICDNHTVDFLHKEGESGYSAATRDVRKIYNSRYSGSFYDDFNNLALSGVNYYLDSNGVERQAGTLKDSAIMHVNNMYWQAHGFTTTEQRRVFCQDFCLTKNTIKARTTRKGLVSTDWTNPDNEAGFRDKNYPVRPYFKYITDNQGNVILDNEGNPRTEWSDVVRGDWNASNTYNYTDLSKYNKMRIIGSQNTQFVIRYATSLSSNYHPTYNVPVVEAWKEIKVKTDANGEVNVDLDYLKAKDNSDKFCLQLILFDGIADLVWSGNGEQIGNASTPGGLRETIYVNNIELFEGEGRLVDLVGLKNLEDPNVNVLDNMYHVWNNDNNYQWQYATVVDWTCPAFENHIGVAHSTIWGDPSVNPENYADLTGYKKIRIYGPSGQTLRLFYNSMRYGPAPHLNVNAPFVDEGGKENIYYQLENLTTTTENHPNGESYAEFDLSNFEFFHLNSIKASAHNTQATVTAIKLVEDEEADYIFYGNGGYGEQDKTKIDPTVAAATKDLTAKVIDTRARCNNMQVPYDGEIFDYVEHIILPQTANPNVLFIERTNQFRGRFVKYVKFQDSNNIEKDFNLIVPSNKNFDNDATSENFSEYFTSNNIELSDGYSFYAPKKIKAKTAKYTRTFKNNSAAVNSIILPFAVSAGNDETYGFYETNVTLKSTTNEGKVGILKDEDVNEGDWLLQFKKTTGNTKANTPYLYAVASGGEVDFIGVKESGTVIIPETPDVQVPAHKNMTNNLPNADNPTYDFYLRGVYEGTYMEHILFYGADGTFYRTPFMTVTPFRTIIKSPIDVTDETWKEDQTNYFTPASGVKVVLAFDPHDDSSDINEVVADGLFAEDEPIYNVAGQRVNTFGKGIYIIGGKKILVK